MKIFRLSLACLPFLLLSHVTVAQETAVPPILIAKFNFEAEDSLAPWRQDLGKDEPPNKLTLSADTPHGGNAALQFTVVNTSARKRNIYTGLDLPPSTGDRHLRLRFYARSTNTESGQMVVGLLERSATGVIGWAQGKATYTVKSGAQWQENELEVLLNKDTRVITLYFGLKNPVASQSFGLDDISAETY